MREAIRRLAELKGILPRYTDVTGQVRDTTDDTATALLQALGEPVDNPEDRVRSLEAQGAHVAPLWCVVDHVINRLILLCQTDVCGNWRLEDGGTIEGRAPTALPPLPLGIHRLWINGRKTVLLAAPPRLPLPDPSWGIMVPLWGLRGADRGGLGDFADLAEVAAALDGTGPQFIGINPIHAGFPLVDAAYSPYQPSHRRRLNVMHIPVTAAASTGPLIDYAAEFALRRATFADVYDADETDPRFEAFCAAEGPALERFARHQALSEQCGPYWTDWPADLRDPATARPEDPTRVRYHMWLQWQADLALSAARDVAQSAGLRHGLYLDLAVGTHPTGAETWEDAASFVRGVSLGAPPDALGPEGQVWNLAPFHPDTLIEQDFQPLAETLRHQLRYGGVLRIDHILGFDRAFWVPETGAPGGYVRMPRDAMLAVARIEAARVGAVIVGEDLGVVPDGLREALDRSGILGCRVAMFEKDGTGFRPGAQYPEAAIASFSTHDLPTWAGWRAGQDLLDWAALGAISADALETAQVERAADVAAFDTNASDGLHSFLARNNARLVAVQAETLFEMRAQPNLPGTTTEYPNWRHRLPRPAWDLPDLPQFRATATAMGNSAR